MSLLLAPCSSVSIINFEHVISDWVIAEIEKVEQCWDLHHPAKPLNCNRQITMSFLRFQKWPFKQKNPSLFRPLYWNTVDLQNIMCRVARIIAQKMKFSIKYFFSKCDQIRNFLRIWSHLLNKYIMENFIFCARIVFAGSEQLFNKTLHKNDYLIKKQLDRYLRVQKVNSKNIITKVTVMKTEWCQLTSWKTSSLLLLLSS